MAKELEMKTKTELDNLLKLGEALLEVGEPEGASKVFDDALKIDSTNKAALTGRTHSLANMGQLEEAVKNAEFTTRQHPDDASLWDTLGTVALASGDSELAFLAFTNVQKLIGPNVSNLVNLTRASHLSLDIDRARQYVEQAIQEDPENQEAQAWKGRLDGIEDKVALLVDVGKTHCQQGRLNKGIELFREALLLEDSLPAIEGLSRALLVMNQMEEAVINLKKVSERIPGDPEALVDLGNAYYLLNESKSASTYYSRALDLDSNQLFALIGLARVSLADGDLNKSMGYIERVFKINSSEPEAWLIKARIHSANDEGFEARKSADHAIALDIASAPAWAIGEEILRKQGKEELGDLYLLQVNRYAPGMARVQPPKGTVDFENDAAELEEVTDSQIFKEICRDRAIVFAALDMPEFALKYLDLFSIKFPDIVDENVLTQKGVLFLGIGKHAEARECFERVLKANSSNKNAQKGLMEIDSIMKTKIESIAIRKKSNESSPAQIASSDKVEVESTPKNIETSIEDGKSKPDVDQEAKVFCRHCGNKVRQDAKFCNHCGQEIKWRYF